MGDDIVTELRRQLGLCGHSSPTYTLADCIRCGRIQAVIDEIKRLRAALAGIDRLHHCFDSMDGSSAAICWHCGRNWPCETHQKVQEARRG